MASSDVPPNTMQAAYLCISIMRPIVKWTVRFYMMPYIRTKTYKYISKDNQIYEKSEVPALSNTKSFIAGPYSEFAWTGAAVIRNFEHPSLMGENPLMHCLVYDIYPIPYMLRLVNTVHDPTKVLTHRRTINLVGKWFLGTCCGSMIIDSLALKKSKILMMLFGIPVLDFVIDCMISDGPCYELTGTESIIQQYADTIFDVDNMRVRNIGVILNNIVTGYITSVNRQLPRGYSKFALNSRLLLEYICAFLNPISYRDINDANAAQCRKCMQPLSLHSFEDSEEEDVCNSCDKTLYTKIQNLKSKQEIKDRNKLINTMHKVRVATNKMVHPPVSAPAAKRFLTAEEQMIILGNIYQICKLLNQQNLTKRYSLLQTSVVFGI